MCVKAKRFWQRELAQTPGEVEGVDRQPGLEVEAVRVDAIGADARVEMELLAAEPLGLLP